MPDSYRARTGPCPQVLCQRSSRAAPLVVETERTGSIGDARLFDAAGLFGMNLGGLDPVRERTPDAHADCTAAGSVTLIVPLTNHDAG